MRPMERVVFTLDGDRFIATELAAGPWDPSTQHGGVASALLAHAMERCEPGWSASDGQVMMARITIEILRPVPIGSPLDVHVNVVQAGRRTHRLEATMEVDGKQVARASGLRVPLVAVELPADLKMSDYERTPPDPNAPWERPRWMAEDPSWGKSSGHGLDAWTNFADVCDHRVVDGTWDDPGECMVWIKVEADMIDGIGTTPLMRVLTTADGSAGIGRVLPFEEYTHPNADLNVHLFRYPVGDWVGIRCLMWPSDHGVAVGDGELWDEKGRIGRTTQACIVTKR
jgi:acyl-coenzyme A thioesterase PaaI-like protein